MNLQKSSPYKTETAYPLINFPIAPSPASGNYHLYSVFMSESLCDCPISLSKVFLKVIHVVACVKIFLFFKAE